MSNVWSDDYRPYGVNEGRRGSRSQWKRAYDKLMAPDEDTAYMTCWEILGISEDATLKQIKKAFRILAFKTHPDHGGTSEAFRRVNGAYEEILRSRGEL